MVSALFLCYILVLSHISGATLADKYKPVTDKALDFIFKSGCFKANSLIFFLRLHFSYFNPLNSHSIPFFSNLLSKDKNKVMLQCSLQDWHQFNRNPSPW